MIETGTTYSLLLSEISHLSFESVRKLSVNFVKQLSPEKQEELHSDLESGRCIIDDEPHLCQYMHDYGKMHQAKLEYSYNLLPPDFFDNEIEIIDWGCGQGLATMVYCDFLSQKNIKQNIHSVTLIEPSELALKRASLHIKAILPKAEIRTINKFIGSLKTEDFLLNQRINKLHLFSNILDVESVDLIILKKLVSSLFRSTSYYICVSPIYDNCNEYECNNGCRLANFTESLCGKQIGSLCQRSFISSKTWTINTRIISKELNGYSITNNCKISEFNKGLAVIEQEGKFGIINEERQIVLPIIYDSLYWDNVEPSFLDVKLNGKFGCIDKYGNEIISIKYDCPIRFNIYKFAKALYNSKYGLINNEGKIIIGFNYEEIGSHFSEEVINAKKNGKWGFIDKHERIVIPFRYAGVLSEFNNGVAVVECDGEKYFIDKSGNRQYDFTIVNGFCNNIALIRKGKRFGYVDNKGNIIIIPKYKKANEFSYGLAAVQERVKLFPFIGKWGYIDTTGKKVVDYQYDEASEFSDKIAKVKKGNKWGIINNEGQQITPLIYEDILNMWGKLIPAKRKGKWLFLNYKGTEVVPPKYDDIYSKEFTFREGLAAVSINEKWGFIDGSGNEVVPIQYDGVKCFCEGLAAVKLNNKWGFIDKVNQKLTEFKFDKVRDFHDGLAAVGIKNDLKGKLLDSEYRIIKVNNISKEQLYKELEYIGIGYNFGFINKKGDISIPLNFDIVTDFNRDRAFVNIGGVEEIMKKEFLLFPVDFFSGDYKNLGRWGLIDSSGKLVVDFKWDNVNRGFFGTDTTFVVHAEGMWHSIDINGNYINKTNT